MACSLTHSAEHDDCIALIVSINARKIISTAGRAVVARAGKCGKTTLCFDKVRFLVQLDERVLREVVTFSTSKHAPNTGSNNYKGENVNFARFAILCSR